MSEDTKDLLVVAGVVAGIVAAVLYVAAVAIPSYWRAHNECSGTNGIVTEQKDFLTPTICLRVNPGSQR